MLKFRQGIAISKSREMFTHALVLMSLLAGGSSIAAGIRGGFFRIAMARLNIRIRNRLFASIVTQEVGVFMMLFFFIALCWGLLYLYCIFIWQDVTGNVLCDSGLAVLKVVVLGVLELRVVTKTIAVRFFASGPTRQRRPSLVAFYDSPEMVWQFYRITWT